MNYALSLRNVSGSYGATAALHNITLDVAVGEVVALLGANGAGKTSTLRAICHMMIRPQGSINLFGQSIANKSTEQIARLGVGHVPDGRGTFLSLAVEETSALAASHDEMSRAWMPSSLESTTTSPD